MWGRGDHVVGLVDTFLACGHPEIHHPAAGTCMTLMTGLIYFFPYYAHGVCFWNDEIIPCMHGADDRRLIYFLAWRTGTQCFLEGKNRFMARVRLLPSASWPPVRRRPTQHTYVSLSPPSHRRACPSAPVVLLLPISTSRPYDPPFHNKQIASHSP